MAGLRAVAGRRVVITGALLVAGLAGLSGRPAQGAAAAQVTTSQVSAFNNGAEFVSGTGLANDLTVSVATIAPVNGVAAWRFTFDDTHPITPGQGCSRPGSDQTVATCDVFQDPADSQPAVGIDLGDRDDRLRTTGEFFISLYAGTGNDDVEGSSSGRVHGEAGNDTVTGAQYAWGGDGDDTLQVTRSGWGENGKDVVSGGAAAQELYGGPGDDQVLGADDGDTLFGNSGADRLLGGRGDDYLSGGPGADRLYGNSGDDTLLGGPGQDLLSGGTGANLLYP